MINGAKYLLIFRMKWQGSISDEQLAKGMKEIAENLLDPQSLAEFSTAIQNSIISRRNEVIPPNMMEGIILLPIENLRTAMSIVSIFDTKHKIRGYLVGFHLLEIKNLRHTKGGLDLSEYIAKMLSDQNDYSSSEEVNLNHYKNIKVSLPSIFFNLCNTKLSNLPILASFFFLLSLPFILLQESDANLFATLALAFMITGLIWKGFQFLTSSMKLAKRSHQS